MAPTPSQHTLMWRLRPGSGVGMNQLIPTVDKLKEIFDRTSTGSTSDQIRLPQIAVVGPQSGGKSSVLESLVGQPFLPRGTGIVTRCPIVIQLRHSEVETPWCEFLHKKGHKYTDFEDAEREIIAQTKKIAGGDNEISKESITITVYSQDVLDLTVVDLPGLVKIPTGNQPDDIEAQVKELVLEYITQKNCIILAVSPGNVDIANSEGLKIAKEVDPMQERTIAVVTKVDLAGDIYDVLTGKTVAVKLGVVGVKNRSQDDIDAGKSIKDVLEEERQFFKDNYKTIARHHGIQFLAGSLNDLLKRHIAACCPSLEVRVRALEQATQETLDDLGTEEEMTDAEKKLKVITIIDKFAKAYKAQVDGQSRSEIVSDKLTSGAKIDTEFFTTLKANLIDINILDGITDQEIVNAIRNAATVGSRMTTPEVALDHIVKKEIAKLKDITHACANAVHQEMITMIAKCMPDSRRFPKVNKAISEIVTGLLDAKMKGTERVLNDYMEIQASTGQTNNIQYARLFNECMSNVNAVELRMLPIEFDQNKHDGVMNPTVKDVLEKMKVLVHAMFNIVREQVLDHVPKTILHSLVNKTVDNVGIQLNFWISSSDEDAIEQLVSEPAEIQEMRSRLKAELQEYQEAAKILEDLRSGWFQLQS